MTRDPDHPLAPAPVTPASPPAIPESTAPSAPEKKPRPVPQKVRRAIQMMVQGNVRTWAAAAKRVDCAPETMSRWFKRPECRQALRDSVERAVVMSAGRASARLTQLLDSSSQRTALDATRLSLQAAGIIGSGQNVAVNVGVQLRAGYVIDLRERSDRGGPLPPITIDGAGAVVVDEKPEAIAGIGPDGRKTD